MERYTPCIQQKINVTSPTLRVLSTVSHTSTLPSEDIGTFVRAAYPNAPDAPDSNPYHLTLGPDGDLLIVDAGLMPWCTGRKRTEA
ncbi:hypothetical protein [Larkinella arboricola]